MEILLEHIKDAEWAEAQVIIKSFTPTMVSVEKRHDYVYEMWQ